MHPADPPRAVYIHVPFCQSRCTYCDFYSTVARGPDLAAWHRGILAEVERLRRYPVKRPLMSVYFGGGTPSLLDPAWPAEQLNRLRAVFGIAAEAEITLEANPESVTAEKAAIWRASGINRVSLGLQSAAPTVLRTLGRPHTADDFAAAVDTLQAAGMANISADLMLGIPGQTMADLDMSLDLLERLALPHMSFYSLSLEPGTPLHAAWAHRFPDAAAELLEREMYWHTRARLEAAGLPVYELSNAARPGFESAHNRVYWRGEPYFGLGPSAASYSDLVRRQHPASLDAWLARLKAPPEETGDYTTAPAVETIDESSQRHEYMMLGLRLTAGPDLARYEATFGDDPRRTFAGEIAALEDAGLAALDGHAFALTRHGIDFANLAFAAFV